MVLTDGLAVTHGGDVLDGGDHFVVTVEALSDVTRSQGGRRGWGCGGGGFWGCLQAKSSYFFLTLHFRYNM